jgi:hypothetical protein
MTREVRVGIVSGCLGAPMRSVGKSDLFHQVAARQLAECGINLRVSLRSIDDYRLDRMTAHLDFLARERGCDVLAFQIRPTLLRQAEVVFWKDRRRPGSPRMRLSPFYWKDLNDWAPPEGLTPTSRFPSANDAVAWWTRLLGRAQRQVLAQLLAVARHARHVLRRPLVFIGPVFNATLEPTGHQRWTPLLRARVSSFETPFVDLCDFRLAATPERFEADGFHLNKHGHRLVGERFAAAIETAWPAAHHRAQA